MTNCYLGAGRGLSPRVSAMPNMPECVMRVIARKSNSPGLRCACCSSFSYKRRPETSRHSMSGQWNTAVLRVIASANWDPEPQPRTKTCTRQEVASRRSERSVHHGRPALAIFGVDTRILLVEAWRPAIAGGWEGTANATALDAIATPQLSEPVRIPSASECAGSETSLSSTRTSFPLSLVHLGCIAMQVPA